MYDTAKKAREALKSKARRLATEKTGKVSSSDWTPPEPLNADVKTGARPISRRAYKSGGKVDGSCGAMRADRKPRKAGGKAESEKAEAKQYAIAKVNRNVKDANEQREGIKHVGGFKKGGRTKKEEGGSIESMIANMDKTEAKTDLPKRGPMPPKRPVDVTPAAKNPMKPDMRKAIPGDVITGGSGASGTSRKTGGRTKKMMGGGMFNPAAGMAGGMQAPMQPDPRQNMVSPNSMNFIGNPVTPGVSGMKKGGKVSHAEWEHSKKDLAEDKKLAKKHGMSLEQWEKSAADKKHDKQQSMKGLMGKSEAPKRMNRAEGGKIEKRDGKAIGGVLGESLSPLLMGINALRGDKKDGGRTARKAGGRTKAKGKTNIAIVINAGQKGGMPADGMGAPPITAGPTDGLPIPVPPPKGAMPAGGAMPMPMPMPMPAPGGAPGAAGMPPLPRKAGGRITKRASSYKDMEAGAGSGEGRLQKTDIAAKLPKPGLKRGVIVDDNKGYPNKVNGAVGGRTARASGGKTYRSYKDMDAGAGSGKGRLEKTEIEAHKR